MAHVECVYTSVAVNPSPQCLDWSPTSGLVAYGASNAVLLAPPELKTISDTLVGHEQRVNCVKWMRKQILEDVVADDKSIHEEEIVSGSKDGTIRVWRRNNCDSSSSTSSSSFSCTNVLSGHQSSVNVVDAIRFSDGDDKDGLEIVTTLIASAASDASIRIWRRREVVGGGGRGGDRSSQNPGNIAQFECIVDNLPKSFSFSLALRWTLIPPGNHIPNGGGDDDSLHSNKPIALLLVSGDDSNIHVFSQSSKSSSFSSVSTLRGHDDWVRSLDVTVVPSEADADVGSGSSTKKNDLLIASGGQDAIVRLWRFATFENRNSTASDGEESEVKLKSRRFMLGDGREVGVVLESVLVGHEGSVYSVCWNSDGRSLLTSSMDKTLIIWKLDPASGVWLDETRVGDVGGNTLGFYGALFRYGKGEKYAGNGGTDAGNGVTDADSILGHDFQGALHLWRRDSADSTSSSWFPYHAIGGHFRSVEDVAWDGFGGGYGLLSVSGDQTTRFHAPWTNFAASDDSSSIGSQKALWVEVGRPQIHGYDMTCVSSVAPGFRFISGADEKVLRVFEAPNNFFDVVEKLSGVCVKDALKTSVAGGGPEVGSGAVIGAAVPALGLSNKAIREGTAPSDLETDEFLNAGLKIIRPPEEISLNNNKGLVVYPKPPAASSSDQPPLETDLLQNTLWPEAQKLYGHGNPLFCVASSVDGKLQASACKAAKPDEAAILLWGGVDRQWRQLGEIGDGHSLTVTRMAFGKTEIASRSSSSSSSSYVYRLLSVSRDRTIVVTDIELPADENDDQIVTKVIFRTNKSNSVHSRIIWSCDWAHDDSFFVTASRDKKIVAWRENGEAKGVNDRYNSSVPAALSDSCTAVACAARRFDATGSHLIAAGLDNGDIHLLLFDSTQFEFRELFRFAKNICHHLTVKRLAFRPASGRACDRNGGVNDNVGDRNGGANDGDNDTTLQLASCGADGLVRVFDVTAG